MPPPSSSKFGESEMDDDRQYGGIGVNAMMAQKRCEVPEIQAPHSNKIYLNETISIIMKDQDKSAYLSKLSINPLNAQNTRTLEIRDALRNQH